MADLRPPEVEKARLHFDIYDFEGQGKVDYHHLGDLLRSLDLRPTQEIVAKNGWEKKKGQKYMTFEEFLPIYSQVKKDKDCGAYEDLVEGLKVYDKAENGTMMEAELAHVLLSLGEKLDDSEVEEIIKTCAGGCDDEGFIKYETFIKNVMAGPFPEEAGKS
ncbi:myosin light chain alkali [Dermatophagoides pteronyssinus]